LHRINMRSRAQISRLKVGQRASYLVQLLRLQPRSLAQLGRFGFAFDQITDCLLYLARQGGTL
jgi:hypothetical protein